VTKGVIKTARKAVYLPDPHIVISGHIHESWKVDLMRLRLGKTGTYHDKQTHLCIPTYKEELGAPPKPIGAYWLRLFYVNKRDEDLGFNKYIDYEILEAK
jgi:hypothetical protein